MFSRPSRLLRTSPACSITRRCFVTAWRVIAEPVVNRVMDKRAPSESRAASRSRVRSPSAANTVAVALSCEVPRALRRTAHARPDEVEHHRPLAIVGGEAIGLPRENPIQQGRCGGSHASCPSPSYRGRRHGAHVARVRPARRARQPHNGLTASGGRHVLDVQPLVAMWRPATV